MINYLFQSIIIIAVLTLAYKIIFHNSKHLYLRRIIILIMPIFALWAPLLKQLTFINTSSLSKIGTLKTLQEINISSSIKHLTNLPQNDNFNNLLYFSLTVSTLLLINFIHKIIQIYKLGEKSISIDGNIYYTTKNHNPFSFLGHIYIPYKGKGKESIKLIVKHEQVHLEQLHSIDILYFEIIKIVFWFNPFFYILKNELLQVHEFLVDENITQDERIIESYMNTILNYNFIKPLNIANNFNHSFTKKRFIMMNKKNNKSKKDAILKVLTMLTIVFMTIITTTQCNKGKEIESNEFNIESKNKDLVEYKNLDIKPEFPKGNKAMMRFLGENTKYPQIAKENGVAAKCYISFTISEEGKVSDVEIARFKQLGISNENKNRESLTSAIQSIKEEAIRVVNSMPNWIPGEKDGEKVSVKYIIPLVFELQ